MAGSVRVGSICISRELGLEKLLVFRGALTLGQKLDQLYFQTYPLNARFPGVCGFNQTFSFSFDCFRFQIHVLIVRF